jgi:hypothetical protein
VCVCVCVCVLCVCVCVCARARARVISLHCSKQVHMKERASFLSVKDFCHAPFPNQSVCGNERDLEPQP